MLVFVAGESSPRTSAVNDRTGRRRSVMWRKIAIFALAALGTVPGNNLWAWNKAGHMVSGALAYQILKKESPGTIAKVIALLKEHPEYEKSWEARLQRIDKADRDLFL